jgi:hypothetical protein
MTDVIQTEGRAEILKTGPNFDFERDGIAFSAIDPSQAIAVPECRSGTIHPCGREKMGD